MKRSISGILQARTWQTAVLQCSVQELFGELQALQTELQAEHGPQKTIVLSCDASQRCSAVEDALHFQKPVLLLHVAPECLCRLGSDVLHISAHGDILSDVEGVYEALKSSQLCGNSQLPLWSQALLASTQIRKQLNIDSPERLREAAQGPLRLRARFCVKRDVNEALGLIVGDSRPETLQTALRLKRALLDQFEIHSSLFYFGARLDEAKLLNAETVRKYVFLSGCRALNTPWLSASFQRIPQRSAVELLTLFELKCQLGLVEFCFEYENDGVW